MKLAVTISRILLGVIFVFFGTNGLFPFLPLPPIPGVAGQFLGALIASHYVAVVALIQLIGGVLLLANRYVPFALLILGPVIVNILLFHILMQPAGLPPGLLAATLWFVVFYHVRRAFAGIFVSKVEG